MLLLTIIIMMM